jgi:hypothetical protein
MTMDDERIRDYVGGLPEASGTFTGTFDPAEVDLDALLGPVPDLMPVEIDTFDRPNPLGQYREGEMLRITSGDRQWAFPIDHAEPLGDNRVRVWVRRQPHGAE